jgi:3'(2'), 5'-bisphosphate nucleotidase
MLGKALDIVTKAGKILEKYWNATLNIETKLDGSIVTQADLEVNEFLTQNLTNVYPVPIISEEKIPDWEVRKEYKDYWLIDPLDGTLEFINRFGDFCICVAYMREQRPICGIIHAPALDETYVGIENAGVSFYQKGKREKLQFPTTDYFIVAKSRFHNEKIVDDFCTRNGIAQHVIAGGAIKFGRIALGTISVYPRYYGPKEWDVAAGDIIVHESGGRMTSIATKQPLLYNNENMQVDPFLAIGHGMLLHDIRA